MKKKNKKNKKVNKEMNSSNNKIDIELCREYSNAIKIFNELHFLMNEEPNELYKTIRECYKQHRDEVGLMADLVVAILMSLAEAKSLSDELYSNLIHSYMEIDNHCIDNYEGYKRLIYCRKVYRADDPYKANHGVPYLVWANFMSLNNTLMKKHQSIKNLTPDNITLVMLKEIEKLNLTGKIVFTNSKEGLISRITYVLSNGLSYQTHFYNVDKNLNCDISFGIKLSNVLDSKFIATNYPHLIKEYDDIESLIA